MNNVRYDRLLHSYRISMIRHCPAVSNLLACGLYNVVTLSHYTAGLIACLLVKTLQVDPSNWIEELGVPRACRNHNSLCAYLNFKSPSHDHHISVIKHQGG